jgi:hypothetical protein
MTKSFAEASCSAIKTLALVSPDVALPRIIDQLRADINPVTVNSLNRAGTWDLGYPHWDNLCEW